jgi:hypothetical protein
MAPLRIDTIGPFSSGGLGVRTISTLCACFALCTFLAIKHLKRRFKMGPTEELTPFPSVEEKHVGCDIFEAQDPISAVDRQLLTYLLNPLLIGSPRKSSLLTSGYLAAKAKMATTEKPPPLEKPEEIDVLELQVHDIDYSKTEHPTLQWSRRSSPGPQVSLHGLQVTAAVDYDDEQHVVQLSALQAEAKFDGTQHFCDDHHPRIKWRRRTLIFEKSP